MCRLNIRVAFTAATNKYCKIEKARKHEFLIEGTDTGTLIKLRSRAPRTIA